MAGCGGGVRRRGKRCRADRCNVSARSESGDGWQQQRWSRRWLKGRCYEGGFGGVEPPALYRKWGRTGLGKGK
ncbi:hypothetical protein COCNU_06G011210 [Cocos nucifera]|uniref:Uncharacterized protein n=1 Tax=Cocos nucifera TaxID=13894 RepID=A0A8K0ICE1_COCNU|nr:hypothetical protein COCNU_06G011210 [Cocos nucifera]